MIWESDGMGGWQLTELPDLGFGANSLTEGVPDDHGHRRGLRLRRHGQHAARPLGAA